MCTFSRHLWKDHPFKALFTVGNPIQPIGFSGISEERERFGSTVYFDRIIRDERELIEKASYILNNPVKRWPEMEEYEWVCVGESGS